MEMETEGGGGMDFHEPWKMGLKLVGDKFVGDICAVTDARNHQVADMGIHLSPLDGCSEQDATDYGQRIAACVNACQTIPTNILLRIAEQNEEDGFMADGQTYFADAAIEWLKGMRAIYETKIRHEARRQDC